jgi:hypothetical protein
MPFGIFGQQSASSIEMGVLANAGENIQHLASVRLRILHAIRGEKRQSICARKMNEFAINAFLTANEMSLNFDENIFAAKRVDQKSGAVSKTLGSARVSRTGEGVLAIANFFDRSKSMMNCEFFERLFRRDTETSTRDACAPQNGDQPFSELRELIPSHCACAFFAAQMRLSE